MNAGLHPFEYAGMEAAIRLSKNIDPSGVKGALVIIPIANVAGFLKGIETVHPLCGGSAPGTDDGFGDFGFDRVGDGGRDAVD